MQLISAIVSLTLISSTVNAHPHNKGKRGIPWKQPWNWQTQPSISCPEYSTSTITALTSITHTTYITESAHQAPPSRDWNERPHTPSVWTTSPPEIHSTTSICTDFPTSTLPETSSWVEPSPSPIPTELDCQPDNCLREIFDSRFSALASEFCMTYTQSTNAEASVIPTYLENCDGDAHAVSSACSCLFVAPSTSAVPAPKETKPMTKETIPTPGSWPTHESWPSPASVVHPTIAPETPSAPKDAWPAPTPKAVYARALGLGLPLGLPLNLPALGLVSNLPTSLLGPVVSQVESLLGAVGSGVAELLQCGVQGPASVNCPLRLVGFVDDIPLSLIGCYRACEGYPGGCSSYSFYHDASGSAVCDLYEGTVSQSLGTTETDLGSVWYDLKCGLPIKG